MLRSRPKFMFLLCLLTVVLPSSIGRAEGQTPSVLFFGDSLTAGKDVAKDEAFPAVVERLGRTDGVEFTSINGGLSGDTSAGGVRRIDWYLKRPFTVFFIALGANDGLRGLPAAETEKNLSIIIEKVQVERPGIAVVVAGMMLPATYGNKTDEEFQQLFKRVAVKYGATFYPFLLEGVGGDPKLNNPDGIHPNAAGHQIIAEHLWPVLKPLLVAAGNKETANIPDSQK